MRCPCCGQPWDNDGLVCDLNTNTVTAHGKTVLLHPIQAELCHVLLQKMPAAVRFTTLANLIWGIYDQSDFIARRIYVARCHLRKKILPLGLDVVSTRGRLFSEGGYRLVWLNTALPALGRRYQRSSLPIQS